jgi:nucleoside-diphosphate-sugar epimerase
MSLSLETYAGKLVLVTGATGFTGRVVTRKLIDAGAKVRAIARTSSDLGNLQELDIQWFRGDIYDPDLVSEAAKDVNYVIHLAAAFREEKSTDDDYRRVHVTGTALLARAVLESKELECFVHISTVGVHGHIEIDRADENYRFAPGDGYQRTKLEAEQWIEEYASKNGIPFTIIRPGPIYGPGDMRLLKLYRMINRGILLMLGKGKGIYHLVHVDDISNIILLAGITPEAHSEIMIAANDDPITIKNMANTIAEKLGVKKLRTIRLPLFPFYLASDICKFVCSPLGIQPPIYRRRVDFYTKDRSFSNAKVKRLLDYEFRYDNESGIEDTVNWYRSNNLLN